MTIKEQITDYLQNHPEGLSPTSIGLYLGYDYNKASASVNLPLAELVKDKVLDKVINGRKVLYKLKTK